MSVNKLLAANPIPMVPNLQDKDSLEKWIRDIHEYLRRLSALFSGDNIVNSIITEGNTTTITNLVNFVDIQTVAFDADDLVIYSELETDSDAYKLYLDISAMTGYEDDEYQFIVHDDAAGAKWVGIEDWADYDGTKQQVLTHDSSGVLTWVDTDTC